MLLGGSLGLAIRRVSFFDISMLLYGKVLKLTGLSHFLADFGALKK